MPIWNTANNVKRGSSQVIKMLRGGNSPWAAYNAASGGTETTDTNYNGSGETWKIHTFTTSGTLTVTQSVGVFPFRVLWVGGGGNGGAVNTAVHGAVGAAGGGAGRVCESTNFSISSGAHTVTVGAGGGNDTVAFGQTAPGGGYGGSPAGGAGGAGGSGGGGGGSHSTGGAGGAAVAGTPIAGFGAAGGNAPTGGMASQPGGNAGGTTGSGGYYESDITGATDQYGRGGNNSTGAGTNSGYGSGGNGGNNASGPGQSGVVIVAYRTA